MAEINKREITIREIKDVLTGARHHWLNSLGLNDEMKVSFILFDPTATGCQSLLIQHVDDIYEQGFKPVGGDLVYDPDWNSDKY